MITPDSPTASRVAWTLASELPPLDPLPSVAAIAPEQLGATRTG